MPEGTRWLLNHGRVYRQVAGAQAHGHGVLIDITERRLRGADANESQDEPETGLERAARHALDARNAIDADGSSSLRLPIDMVLLKVGRAIAQRVRAQRADDLN